MYKNVTLDTQNGVSSSKPAADDAIIMAYINAQRSAQ